MKTSLTKSNKVIKIKNPILFGLIFFMLFFSFCNSGPTKEQVAAMAKVKLDSIAAFEAAQAINSEIENEGTDATQDEVNSNSWNFPSQQPQYLITDLNKEGLSGKVKIIETTVVDVSKNEIISNSSREFNELGKLKSIVSNSDFADKIEDFEMSYMPKEFDEEFLVVLPFCRTKGTLHIGNRKEYGFGGSTNLSFEYDSEGKLVSTGDRKFIYDADGNLIEKNFYEPVKERYNWYDKIDTNRILYLKVKYKWFDGNLVSKLTYNSKGDVYDEFYDIEYKDNQQIIKAYTYSKDEPNYVITNTFNSKGQIINKKRENGESYKSSLTGPNLVDTWNYYYYYEYNNGLITEIGNMKKGYRPMVGGGPERVISEKNTIVKIERDEHGSTLYIEKGNRHENEWEYEYDNNGNWIKRTEFEVKMGDIKITKKRYTVTRKILYY